MIENKTPLEALEWLTGKFRAYTRNQITWLEVRNILLDTEGYIETERTRQRNGVLRPFATDDEPTLALAANILNLPVETLDKNFGVNVIDPFATPPLYVVKQMGNDIEITDGMSSNPMIGTFASQPEPVEEPV